MKIEFYLFHLKTEEVLGPFKSYRDCYDHATDNGIMEDYLLIPQISPSQYFANIGAKGGKTVTKKKIEHLRKIAKLSRKSTTKAATKA